jgi:hypothetical protein
VRLRVKPLTLKQANAAVGEWHRHHKLAVGHRWSIGVYAGDELVGAAIVGRPVARLTPQYSIAEVSRLVTNGTKNGCSILYAACARAARAMGFDEIQTFILADEPGTSLRAAGWQEDPKVSDGGDWNRPSRTGRRKDQPAGKKRRFYRFLTSTALAPE